MDDPVVSTPSSTSAQEPALSLDKVISILFESALEAFVRSILILVFGSIALGIAGGIWRQMAPSAPPGLGIKPEAEMRLSTASNEWFASINQHRLGILFGIILVPTAGLRLLKRNAGVKRSNPRSRLEKIWTRLSEDWFSLVVINAFGAMIAAGILIWVQQFSLPRMLIDWVLNSVLGGIQNVAAFFFGTAATQKILAWLNWYGGNELKFYFWFFYVAAICDDLGIPNLKTLGRWLVHRLRHRRKNRPNTESA